jgi:hypothetical protein
MSRILSIPTETLPDTHLLGLRASWITGVGEDGTEIMLDSGAGFGSGLLSMTVVLKDGRHRTETVNMAPVAEQWANAIRAEMEEQE